MSRYVPARHYISFGIVALALAGFCGWLGLAGRRHSVPRCCSFLPPRCCWSWLATARRSRSYDAHLEIGKRIIPWQDVRRVDRHRLDFAPGRETDALRRRNRAAGLSGRSRLLQAPAPHAAANGDQRDDRRCSVSPVLGRIAGVGRGEAFQLALRATACCGRKTKRKSSASISC